MAKTPSRKTKPAHRKSASESAGATYDAHLNDVARVDNKRSVAARDISTDCPTRCKNPERRDVCAKDFRLFCETYFPDAFPLPWSDNHLTAIEVMERCAVEGGLFAVALPRGNGKTTLSERLAIFAVLYGYRRFVSVVGPTERHAEKMLKKIKRELYLNARLYDDFPHVCHPIRRLKNDAKLCIGQHFKGAPTFIGWSAEQITFATMPDSTCDGAPNVSGAILAAAGLTGALRGQADILASGGVIRPDLVLLDDPQTRESAGSPTQCDERAAIIMGDVLGLAGPGNKIAVIMPCTVVRVGDLADRFLSREISPQWQGIRTGILKSLPTDTAWWSKYADVRAESLRGGRGLKDATELYIREREAADAGAVATWPHNFNPDEASAIQHAMNLRLQDEHAFWAEYQNTPLPELEESVRLMSADEICAKTNGLARGVVPLKAEHLTAFIDVQEQVLFWLVAGWGEDFTGAVVDYGTYPDQRARTFSVRKLMRELSHEFPGHGKEGAIRAGLTALVPKLLARDWMREDGAALRVTRCMIDTGYQADVVHDFCRNSTHAAALMPSRGFGVGAKGKPFSEYIRNPGEKHGWYHMIARTKDRAGLNLRYDTNHWKSFVHARLGVPLGDHGCLSVFGNNALEHRMLAEHILAERPVRVTANGRTIDEWELPPSKPDNHWLDCLVGCAAAAASLGSALESVRTKPKPKRRWIDKWRKLKGIR